MNKVPTAATLVIVSLVCTGAWAQSQRVDVGLDKQLLVDDLVIDSKTNVTRQLGQVTKVNDGKPLLFTRKLRDGRWAPIDVWPLFASVYYDSARQKFRMWHRVSFNDRSRRADEEVTTEEIGVGVDYYRA